ncbi:hypothetical protein [Oxynema aestuarii]|uniref:Uncharacterized protein n=1 Tax=Oxynema aestuarii AP17 TaxID=2064643 RepID=A0A6H1U448_9CYAN|nr:hypothetical protein [Oxynema aestuarii]QIZ72930.1 hypothetical protein HCG48_21930 [Oxynema aestuarii AP17]RMH78515.1 MAG: hypothetical protein D6680_01995 [Cyanobacteria bacterium J007]
MSIFVKPTKAIALDTDKHRGYNRNIGMYELGRSLLLNSFDKIEIAMPLGIYASPAFFVRASLHQPQQIYGDFWQAYKNRVSMMGGQAPQSSYYFQ